MGELKACKLYLSNTIHLVHSQEADQLPIAVPIASLHRGGGIRDPDALKTKQGAKDHQPPARIAVSRGTYVWN